MKENEYEKECVSRIATDVRNEIESQLERNMNKCRMKPFDLEAARNGKPVCTRDGRKARIICFDRKERRRIVALVQTNSEIESLLECYNDGRVFHSDTENDLMMLTEKKEMWINIYKSTTNYISGGGLYDTEEEAKAGADMADDDYFTTAKVSLEV